MSRKIGEAALAKVSAEVLEEEDWKEELLSKMQLLNNSSNNKLKKSKGKTSKGKSSSKTKSGRDRSASDPGTRRRRAATLESKYFCLLFCFVFCVCVLFLFIFILFCGCGCGCVVFCFCFCFFIVVPFFGFMNSKQFLKRACGSLYQSFRSRLSIGRYIFMKS